jgi:hypothetical protein
MSKKQCHFLPVPSGIAVIRLPMKSLLEIEDPDIPALMIAKLLDMRE